MVARSSRRIPADVSAPVAADERQTDSDRPNLGGEASFRPDEAEWFILRQHNFGGQSTGRGLKPLQVLLRIFGRNLASRRSVRATKGL
jgi:hypothetical protein